MRKLAEGLETTTPVETWGTSLQYRLVSVATLHIRTEFLHHVMGIGAAREATSNSSQVPNMGGDSSE